MFTERKCYSSVLKDRPDLYVCAVIGLYTDLLTREDKVIKEESYILLFCSSQN